MTVLVSQDKVRDCPELTAALVFNSSAGLGCAPTALLWDRVGTIESSHMLAWCWCLAVVQSGLSRQIMPLPLIRKRHFRNSPGIPGRCIFTGVIFLKSAISHQKSKASPRFLQSTLKAGGTVSLTLPCPTPNHSVAVKQAALMNKEPANRDYCSESKFHNHCPPLGKAVPGQWALPGRSSIFSPFGQKTRPNDRLSCGEGFAGPLKLLLAVAESKLRGKHGGRKEKEQMKPFPSPWEPVPLHSCCF